ncbi:hypothetical protein Glove_82g40 [Diversispora epigaea]|uniref:Uncharacterized protein n=1 Tax=Diversispora epigaea TaxID=1348612 RepID=A0A397J7Q7_9GLOM|nr:hypothetical protein Glove_82g40 [Diversispora epigaea]
MELKEIDSAFGSHVPEFLDEIVKFLNKFDGKTSLNEIRKIIKEMIFDDNYDHEKHHDKDYIIYALYSLLKEIQNGNLKDTNFEVWFNCHVWNAIFDQAFGDESTSLASALRKNAKRQTGECQKMDKFGAREAGKSWVDNKGTKFLLELGLKLPKLLKDMLKLVKKVHWDKEKRTKIQTVGIIHTDNLKGYICRFQHGKLIEVPDNEENFLSILTIFASVLNIKVDRDSRDNEGSSNENNCYLSPCLLTPKKAKVYVKAHKELCPSTSYNLKGYICRFQHGKLIEVPDNEENFLSILTIFASVLNIKVDRDSRDNEGSSNENNCYLSPCLLTPKKAKVYVKAHKELCPSTSCSGFPSEQFDLFLYLE